MGSIPGSDPWVGKIPWRRKWQHTPAFLPGKIPWIFFLGYSPWGHKRVGHDLVTKQQHDQCNYFCIWKPVLFGLCLMQPGLLPWTFHFRGPSCGFFVRPFDSPWVRNLQDQQSAQRLCPSSITHLALSSWPWAHCRDFIRICPKFILPIVDMLSWWTELAHVSWAIQGWRLGGMEAGSSRLLFSCLGHPGFQGEQVFWKPAERK